MIEVKADPFEVEGKRVVAAIIVFPRQRELGCDNSFLSADRLVAVAGGCVDVGWFSHVKDDGCILQE